MSGDPGGFPAVSSGRDGPDAGDDLSYYYGGPDTRTLGALDPWGEHGPRDQAEADTVLTEAQGREVLRFPTFGDPTLKPVEFADSYARLAATAVAQLEFVDALIADQVAEHGIDALVLQEMESVVLGKGDGAWAELQPTGKQSLAALVQWQSVLRKDVAMLLRDGVKLAIKARQADLIRRYGEWIATTLEGFSSELGVDWDDEATRRAAQRSVLSTRQKLGIGATNPAAAGPPLDDDERVRLGIGVTTGRPV